MFFKCGFSFRESFQSQFVLLSDSFTKVITVFFVLFSVLLITVDFFSIEMQKVGGLKKSIMGKLPE